MVTLINHQSYRICQNETYIFFIFFFLAAILFKDQRLFLSLITHELPIDELKSRWTDFFHSGITLHASIIITY